MAAAAVCVVAWLAWGVVAGLLGVVWFASVRMIAVRMSARRQQILRLLSGRYSLDYVPPEVPGGKQSKVNQSKQSKTKHSKAKQSKVKQSKAKQRKAK
jgi:hypothetical protein